MTRFKDRYRIESTRLPGWDYTSPGYYFVTLCTKDRQPFFGEVIAGRMLLSTMGEIVAQEWCKTAYVRQNVSVDEWVIMPNHLHGIILIEETPQRGVSTTRRGNTKWQSNNLGSIIGQVKSICTKRIRAAGYSEFAWQPRFYDRIVRGQGELDNIRR